MAIQNFKQNFLLFYNNKSLQLIMSFYIKINLHLLFEVV